jgi:hypothetical protein
VRCGFWNNVIAECRASSWELKFLG